MCKSRCVCSLHFLVHSLIVVTSPFDFLKLLTLLFMISYLTYSDPVVLKCEQFLWIVHLLWKNVLIDFLDENVSIDDILKRIDGIR